MNAIQSYLETIYNNAFSTCAATGSAATNLQKEITLQLDSIIDASESSKGVLAVVITGLVYKIHHPRQDVRKHQSSIEGGYSGRTFDTKNITPFLKSKRFPAMAESGWLTRSLEQKVSYDSNYPGAIKPKSLKEAFISIYDAMEIFPETCEDMLLYLFQKLILKRDAQNVPIATPHNLSISDISDLLNRHFAHKYTTPGASRLPVLAIYGAYQAMISQISRYKKKTLLHLAQHNSADTQSGRLGDIDIVDENNLPFEAVEIKLGIPLSHDIIMTAKEKIMPTPVKRYYVLSTAPILDADRKRIDTDIRQIQNIHGCQLIANGVLPTLKYYLRLLEDPALFIDNYARLLQDDNDIKFEHRDYWNQLVANL